MKSWFVPSRLVEQPHGPVKRLVAASFSFAAGVMVGVLHPFSRFFALAMPRCIHAESSYAFPRTFAGKTTRTCCKCGHKREYDMVTMRFLTGHFVERP